MATQQLLPGGVSSVFAPAGDLLADVRMVRAKGARCWDSQGREYIDFVCGYGAVILGHCHEEVNQAVIEQLGQGMLLPAVHPLHDKLADTLSQIFHASDQVLFLKTGSEAVSAAVRLARAFTGRQTIVRCGFHGWHDWAIDHHVPWHMFHPITAAPARVPGIPSAITDGNVIAWTGTDLDALRALLDRRRTAIAALLIDPIQLGEDPGERLRLLREWTQSRDMLLILDEVKTGMRLALGGVQTRYQVWADLTTVSKGLANGFPIAAVLGRSEVMSHASAAKIMGTYNGELVSIAAAIQTIAILRRPGILEALETTGQQLLDGLHRHFQQQGLDEIAQAVAYRWPSMPFIAFSPQVSNINVIKAYFYKHLILSGVLMIPNHMNFTCAALGSEDIELAIVRIVESLAVARDQSRGKS